MSDRHLAEQVGLRAGLDLAAAWHDDQAEQLRQLIAGTQPGSDVARALIRDRLHHSVSAGFIRAIPLPSVADG